MERGVIPSAAIQALIERISRDKKDVGAEMQKIQEPEKDATGASGETPNDTSSVFRIALEHPFFDGGFIARSFASNGEDTPQSTAAREEASLRSDVAQYLFTGETGVNWDDVVGNEEARRALEAAIEHGIKHRELYEHYGKKPSKGVLLSGPPGCGKTMFAKAAASVVAKLHGLKAGDARFLKINGPEIQSCFVGQTEATIRKIFRYAQAYKRLHGHPLTVFIDEADALLPSRDGRTGRPPLPWEESQVAAFLAEMDGIADSGAFVILATNRPYAIDSAVLRDGRCDRKIVVARPTREAATIIFNRHMTSVPLSARCSLPVLSEMVMENFFSPLRKLVKLNHDRGVDFISLGDTVNGAMIVGLVERAKEHALRRDIASGGIPSGVSDQDFEEAVEALTRENMGTLDHYAVMEFCQRTGIEQVSCELIGSGRKIHNVKRAGLH